MHGEEEHLFSQGYTVYCESLDQNRTGLNWMMLREELTSFSALIWFEVFQKKAKIFKNFYIHLTGLNEAMKLHLHSVY